MMAITDDSRKPPPPTDSPPSPPADPWADWQPVWQGQKKSPQDYQEHHSPTEEVHIRLSASRHLQRSRQRIVDARLWRSMEGLQQDAALEIALAYETMGRGLGFVTSRWDHISGIGGGHNNIAEFHAHLVNSYIDWTKMCQAEKVSHAMVIDILCFGISLSTQDKDRRVRKGTARENLKKGLDVYCLMRGWMKFWPS